MTGLRTMRVLAALGALAAGTVPAAAAAAAAELKPFTAEYVVSWKGVTAGRSRLSLRETPDGRWTYESQNAARGLFRMAVPDNLTQRSTFRIVEGRVVPDHFHGDDGSAGSKRDSDVTFDWTAGRATGVAEERKVDIPIPPGLQDGMSVQAALMNELLKGRLPARFDMLDKDQVKDYLYERRGSETVETKVGRVEAEIFSSRRPGSDRGTWFWCAPSLGYLPVKVERRNGDKIEWSMAIQSVERP
jgi:hypothetical protein